MKIFSTLILAICFSLYAKAIDLTSASEKMSCPDIGNTFECAKILEATLLLNEKTILNRKDGNLKIATHSGSIYSAAEIKNVENEAENQYYLAVDISKDKRFVFLFVQYFEGTSWSIFDRKSGVLTPVCGYPLYSPKGHYLAFSEVNLYTEMTPTCLEIYEIEKSSIKEVFVAPTANKWGPESAQWENETRLTFNMLEWNPLVGKESQPEFISTKSELRLENGKWVMVSIK